MNGKVNLRMDTIRAFFSKIRALFLIFKKEQARPPPLPPSCAPASRHGRDIKTPLDSWSLLMTDDILLKIVTNTNKNIEAFVNEHVGFDKNDR